jgi:SNF2 family DNA or RNA helicase
VAVAFDVRRIPEAQRLAMASRIQVAADFQLPELAHWNYALCRQHRMGWIEEIEAEDGTVTQHKVTTKPKPGCQKCGIHFRKHQRVGIAWLYMMKRALLADTVGSGKTAHAAGLIAMCKETGELDDIGRWVLCVRAPALLQWRDQLERMIPGIQVQVAMGTRQQRINKYLGPWEVLLIGPEMLRNDYEMLERFGPFGGLVVDDVDGLRNPENRTAYVLKRIARQADRTVIMTGTPLQKKLHELHSVLEPIGGRQVFGSAKAFERRYVRIEPMSVYNRATGKTVTQNKVVGYKNLPEFKQLIGPLALRRTADDIDDVDLPAIIPHDVELELYPAQAERYAQLKKGVVTILKAEGAMVKQTTALSAINYGQRICCGLAAMGEPDAPRTSVKMDWIMDQLDPDGGDLGDEKVVIFSAYKDTIRALHARFEAAGIGYVTVWGEDKNKESRRASQERFWQDPSCRVLIGTQSIEQSLNLQVARHLINVDMILNPARMEQLAGRIRRDGSAFKSVYVHNLLTLGTQEQGYMALLEREQALIDHVWDTSSELFDAISPMALLDLIGQSSIKAAA